MVTIRKDDRLDAVFAALADPTRRAIIARLATTDLSVGELAEPFAMSRPGISKHLNVLQRAGLVKRIAVGRENHCRFIGKPLLTATEWMLRYRHFWSDQFDALAKHFDNTREDQ